MPDRVAHFPFLPESLGALTSGSFLSGFTEDDLIAAVWRLRRWNLNGSIDWVPVVGSPVNCFNVSDPGYINNGENNAPGFETSPFSSIDDILEKWRETFSQSIGTAGTVAGVTIQWGPRGSYDPAGDPGIGGVLDSELFFNFTNGDDNFYLGTQEGRNVGSETLSNPANVEFTYIDAGGNETVVPLFFGDGDVPGTTDDWDGAIVLRPGDLWWPWVINGDATYDTATGAQLEDPLRNDSNGHPFRRMCRQP
jgi:hypothetical protein